MRDTERFLTAGPGAARYPRLFAPLSIGSVRLANRFAMAPMTTNYAATDGSVTQELIDYLEARAKAGFGLIITENIGVHPSGRVMPRMVMGHHDALVPGLSRLAETLQRHGTRVFAQLSHCGRQSRSAFTGGTLVAPSAIACPVNREVPHALNASEIVALVDAFADAAARMDAAGFDGIELHGAHGYLIGEFLSAYSNRRDDEWGGTRDKRMRFLREIIAAIRRRTQLPLCVRLSADELVPLGNRIDDSLAIAQVLCGDGVQAISVSAGVYESFNALSMVSGEAEGKWLDFAAQMRRALPATVAVMGVGRIRHPDVAEHALAQGWCDLPLFGRAAIADARIPEKAASAAQPLDACLCCNVCLGRSARPQSICPVNPAVGREAAFSEGLARPLDAQLTFVGGGLAALTAAWIAAARGADVELCAGEAALGGMLAQRACVPGQQEWSETVHAAWVRTLAAGVRLVAEPGPGRQVVQVHRLEPVGGATAALCAGAGSPSVYRVLDGTLPIDCSAAYDVHGDDLASVDAALVLARAGARVRLVSTGRIAWDAHPGYRSLGALSLRSHGVAIVAPDLADASAAGAHRIVGRSHGLEPAPAAAAPITHAPVLDAWEPSAMTTGVYAAAAWALELSPFPQPTPEGDRR